MVIPRLTKPQLILLHRLVNEGTLRGEGYDARPMKVLVAQELAAKFGSVFVPTDYAKRVVQLEEMALPPSTPRGKRVGTHGYMRSTFTARQYPEVIFIHDEPIVGPFCVHCGNPLSLHGEGSVCPNRILHPLFPNPSCKCHGVAPEEP